MLSPTGVRLRVFGFGLTLLVAGLFADFFGVGLTGVVVVFVLVVEPAGVVVFVLGGFAAGVVVVFFVRSLCLLLAAVFLAAVVGLGSGADDFVGALLDAGLSVTDIPGLVVVVPVVFFLVVVLIAFSPRWLFTFIFFVVAVGLALLMAAFEGVLLETGFTDFSAVGLAVGPAVDFFTAVDFLALSFALVLTAVFFVVTTGLGLLTGALVAVLLEAG